MRRSVRLAGFDYAGPATYLITIVTHRRSCLFGEIAGGRMSLSPAGEIVRAEWLRSAMLRADICLDAFVIMPDHFHGILSFQGSQIPRSALTDVEAEGITTFRRPARSLGSLIAQFKASSTVRILALTPRCQISRDPARPRRIWQRSFHERILRDPGAIERSRAYVLHNPARWKGPPGGGVIRG